MTRNTKRRILAVAALVLAVGAVLLCRIGTEDVPTLKTSAPRANKAPRVKKATFGGAHGWRSRAGLAGGAGAQGKSRAATILPQKPAGGCILAARTSVLPPDRKGGKEGELREWIVEATDKSYTGHVEEHWRPDARGVPQLVLTREYVANQVLLTLDEGTSPAALRAALAPRGYVVSDPLMELEKGRCIVTVTAKKIAFETVEELLSAVRAVSPRITAEEDPILTACRTPDDPRMGRLWGMKQIQAPEAWSVATEATNVAVAVVDTGVNYFHEDLTDNIVRDTENLEFPWVKGVNFVPGIASNDPMDDNGHGTHCAGTVCARGNNGTGVAGVTWNTQLVPVKSLNCEGKGTTSWFISAYNWARLNKMDILSCSYGGGGYAAAAYSAIRNLQIMDVMLACAAGNGGADGIGDDNDKMPHYPSSYDLDNIVAVASTGAEDELSEFSNYGSSSVDIAAPGEGVLSTCPSYIDPFVGLVTHLSTLDQDKQYMELNGTSMATPHVAGALALVKGCYPDDVYWQTIQRVLLNGDYVEELHDRLSTGMRLNLYKAIMSFIPPAPIVTATAGVYEDRIEVSWKPVKGATYYKLYRRWSEGGAADELTGWTTDLSYRDYAAEPKVGYHYYVRCSKHADGADASPVSPAGVGYKQSPILDEWDPADDVVDGATVLTPTASVQTHGVHSLTDRDPEDWFRVSVVAGQTYLFESSGACDLRADIYCAATTNESDLVAFDDDSGTNGNFRVTYTPDEDGVVYLRVRPWSVAQASWYSLSYSIPGFADAWDPVDDTMDGATELEFEDGERTHGLHALSATDAQDLFTFSLEAGRTYVFSSTGDTDTFGELYFGSVASGDLVAWNDDGMSARTGNDLNFRIVYTPAESGTYYLRVKLAPSGGKPGTYELAYARAAEVYDFAFAERDVVDYVLGWGESMFFATSADATHGKSVFATGEPIFCRWAFCETNYTAVAQSVTNLVELLGSDGRRHAWGHAVCGDGLAEGEFYDFTTEFPALPAGAYLVRITLNSDVDGNASAPEEDMSANVRLCAFTVVAASGDVERIEITGNSVVESKGSAPYRCTATYGDGTELEVAPAWSIAAGGAMASVAADGTLSVGGTATNASVVLRAVFGGQVATKEISVTPEKKEESQFPDPVSYSSQPMTIDAEVYVNGVLAGAGDEVAAYAGGEVRGVAKVGADGHAALSFFVANPGETITFKVFDASEGDEGAVFSCAETVSGTAGQDYGLLVLTATSDDPFGEPEGSGGSAWQDVGTKARIYAEVKVNGYFAGVGDVVAVFVGDKLVGKGRVSLLSSIFGLFTGASGCNIDVCLESESDLTFMVWDRTRRKYCASTTQLRLAPGATKGSPVNRFLIEASDKTRITMRFQKGGWHLVSVPISSDGATVGSVFKGADGVGEVKTADGTCSDGDAVAVGEGYWVETTKDDVVVEVEGDGDEERPILLNAGWNLVGYTLPRAGRVADVLRTALREGKVVEIVGGSATYPGGGLVTMQPGEAYWMRATEVCTIKFERNGMLTAIGSGAGYGPFGDGVDVVRDPVRPVRYRGALVKIGTAPAACGDCVAVYDGAGALRAVARVEEEDGRVTFPVYASEGTTLCAKVWNSAGGEGVSSVYTALGTFSVPAEGGEVTNLVIEVALADGGGSGQGGGSTTNAPASFTVTFDLGERGVRTGGGELSQSVAFGGAAVPPEVSCAAGWELSCWDAPLGDVRADRTVKAIYRESASGGGQSGGGEAPKPRRAADIVFDANGGEGSMDGQTFDYDGSGASLAANAFTREGYSFVGWSTAPGGRAIVSDASGAAGVAAAVGITESGKPATLYAQWARNGLEVGSGTIAANGGSRVRVPVTVDTALSAACLSVRLTFDPNILVYMGVQKGAVAESFDDDFIVTQPKTGELAIGCYATKDVVVGAGELARVVFYVRPGTEGRFSDVTVADVQIADETGVRDVTSGKAVSASSGMVRVMSAGAEVARLENAETVAADTRLGRLELSEGDAIQASDERTPVVVAEGVSASGTIPVEAPVNGWTSGRYALLATTTAGLSFALCGVEGATFSEESSGGVTTYYATLGVEGEVPVKCETESLSPGAQNQIRSMLADKLAGVTEIDVVAPAGLASVIADMGIAPWTTREGTVLTATYAKPELRITAFDPKTGEVRIRVTPGDGNEIVSEISAGCLQAYGTDDLRSEMTLVAEVEADVTPYLKEATKGEAVLHVTLGTHTFLKVIAK